MSNTHWDYFIALEDEFLTTTRFVEVTQDNFGTYSIAYARLLLSAGSEVDVVAKLLCKNVDPSGNPDRIPEYRDILLSRYPGLPNVAANVPRYGFETKPWEEWEEKKSPTWWSAYNKVKHRRHTNFHDANLTNTLRALGGLFVFLVYYYHDDLLGASDFTEPALFKTSVIGDHFVTDGTPLPDFQ